MKHLTALLPGNVPENVNMPLLKLLIETIILTNHEIITYTFVDNLPIINILSFFLICPPL